MYQTTLKDIVEVTRTMGISRFFIFADPIEYKTLDNIDDMFLKDISKSQQKSMTLLEDDMIIYAVDDPGEIVNLEKKAKELGIKRSKIVYDSFMFLDYAFMKKV